MSIWVSVYCRKNLGSIKPDRFVGAIKERIETFSNLYAREDPDETLQRLRVERAPGATALLHLHYREDNVPVVIDRVRGQKLVAGYVEEYLEEGFRTRKGKRAARVRAHLAGVNEIINFCLKQSHSDGMGTPITYAAAAWLAEVGDGLVRIDYWGWARVIKSGELSILVPDE